MLTPLPFRGRWADYGADFLHAPAFAFIAFVVTWAVTRTSFDWKRISIAAVVVAVFATAAELGQNFTGRSATWHDAEANLWGVAIGCLLTIGLRRPRLRLAWVAAAVALVWVQWVPGRLLLDCYRQEREFPLLASFENDYEVYRWQMEHAEFWRSDAHVKHGRWGLHVELQPGLYPHMLYLQPVRDWTGYEALKLEIFLLRKEPLNLVLKIEDVPHNMETEDRFHQRLELQPGWNSISVPLEDVAQGPKDRLLRLDQIKRFEIFAVNLRQPVALVIDHVRLD